MPTFAEKLHEVRKARDFTQDQLAKEMNVSRQTISHFLSPAEEVSAVIVVLDGAEGMFAGLLAELLLSNVPPDEHHDALFGAL